ncbi:MAG: hypothetical protein QM770_24445 [Tepidisphaeraceae bacterium]
MKHHRRTVTHGRRGIMLFDALAALAVLIVLTAVFAVTLHRSDIARRRAEAQRIATAAAENTLHELTLGKGQTEVAEATVKIEEIGATSTGNWVRVTVSTPDGGRAELCGLRPTPSAAGGAR